MFMLHEILCSAILVKVLLLSNIFIFYGREYQFTHVSFGSVWALSNFYKIIETVGLAALLLNENRWLNWLNSKALHVYKNETYSWKCVSDEAKISSVGKVTCDKELQI